MGILARAHRTLTDLFDPVQQGTAPANPVADMLWLDISLTPNQLKRWNGTAWIVVNDTAGILTRLDTAESKITPTAITSTVRNSAEYQSDLSEKNHTWLQAQAPAGAAVGDLWIDTANGNLLKRWNGSAWANVQDAAISISQQTADKINWIIASGTSASNMALTEELFELVTNEVMIQAEESIDLAIQGIRIGGRNLLKDTDILAASNSYLIKEYELSEDWVVGQTYTLRIWGSVNAGQTLGVYRDLGYTGIGEGESFVDGEIVHTFLCPAKNVLGGDSDRILRLYNAPSGTATDATITLIKLEKGNKPTDWTPSPEDPASQASSVVDTGISLSKDGLAMSGPKVDFETDEFLVSSINANRVMMSLTEEGLLVDADVLECQNIVGNVLNTFSESTIEFAGTIQGTLDNLPKYLTQETTITIPEGTYNEDIDIIGFIGQKLYIYFQSGVVINGKILISGCATVHLYAASRGDCKIYSNDSIVLRIYYGNAYIQNLYLFGGAASNNGIVADFAKLCILGCGFKGMSSYCIMYRFASSGWCYNNVGSSNGSYAVRAEQGSAVKLNGAVPQSTSGMTSASFSVIDTFGTISASSGTATTVPSTTAVTYKTTAARRMAVVEQRSGTSLYGGSINWGNWSITSYLDWSAANPRQGILTYAQQQTYAGLIAVTYKQRRDKYFSVWIFDSFAVTGKTIQTAKITIKRSASVGSASSVYLQLYRHAYTSAPTGHSYSLTDTNQQIALKPGEKKTLTLNATQLGLLNSGTTKGYGLFSLGNVLSAEVSASIEMTYA